VLPAHIDDWVDTSDIVKTLFPEGRSHNPVVNFFVIMNEDGTAIQPEGMLNVNAGLIMLTCFFFAWISGMMRATTSMVVGTLFASAAMFASGYSTLGWVSLGAIAIFSVGEMLSSPKFSEFIGNFAPHDKKAMYLGFSQIPIAIGWTLEGKIGPTLYDRFASKDRFSRQMLLERISEGATTLPGEPTLQAMAANADLPAAALAETYHDDPTAFVDLIPQGEAFDWLVTLTGEAPRKLSNFLYETHDVGVVWYVLGGIGIVSAIGIWIYGRWILTMKKPE
jgi:POT family proton-dependent oligopeptide transporter